MARTSKRTRPASIRFDTEIYEKLLQAENLQTPQQVVDFLMKWYEQVKFPILAEAPSMHRQPVPESPKVQVKDLTNRDQSQPRTIHTNAAIERLQKLKNK